MDMVQPDQGYHDFGILTSRFFSGFSMILYGNTCIYQKDLFYLLKCNGIDEDLNSVNKTILLYPEVPGIKSTIILDLPLFRHVRIKKVTYPC
jgi:hypothetical protein